MANAFVNCNSPAAPKGARPSEAGEEMKEACWRRLTCSKEIR